MVEALVLIMALQLAHPMSPTAGEMADARRWIAAKLQGTPAEDQQPEPPCLLVLENNDAVQKNARMGRPLKLGGREYRRGLFCHANSKVVVRLPGPGKAFAATIGLDSNEQTKLGRGSVVFSVRIGEEEAFRSEVMREGMAGVPVEVDLRGAEELVLEVGDAGDGISCDQADWAEARVTLRDGVMLWLGDLPMTGPHRPLPTAELPFSFTYGGRSSAEFLGLWPAERAERKLDENRTEHTLTHTDPETGLVVRCVAVEYHDFPVVEWTLYLKNTGDADTLILESVQAFDTVVQRYGWPEPELAEFVLHHFTGSICRPNDYQPHETKLRAGTEKRLAPSGGRPTNGEFSFFNLEWPSEGRIIAVGWPGQWAAEFARDEAEGLRVRIGQELTHFRLRPGEEVRTPLVAMLFWHGDWVRAQNVWRRWMLAHNVPRPGGELPAPRWNGSSAFWYEEMTKANEANQKMFIDRHLEEGLKLDYWWMDAGWYPNKTGWPNTGTWEVDTGRFPNGLRAITDYAHERGIKCIVWFEPERVTPGTWLYENHPEWLLGADGEQKLLDLGNPEARQWLTDHVDKVITEQGIDLYRQDFNMDPLGYWRANDAEDRQGITEIRHVTGYLAFWDELRRRHPNMLIDTCASGGRRNDLETLRRAVPLHRSDYIFEPVGQQCHTYGLAFWAPFYAAPIVSHEPYEIRSALCPGFTTGWDLRRKDVDWERLGQLAEQWRSIAPCFYGDYYPLTPYSLEDDTWMAWQFDRPDLSRGAVQAFRRAGSVYEAARFRLRGLQPEAQYTVRDVDAPEPTEVNGRELMEKGLYVAITDRPSAVILTYERRDAADEGQHRGRR